MAEQFNVRFHHCHVLTFSQIDGRAFAEYPVSENEDEDDAHRAQRVDFVMELTAKQHENAEIIMTHLIDAFSIGQIKSHFKEGKNSPSVKGVTVCIFEIPITPEQRERGEKPKEIARGYSFCSDSDSFSRRIGRAISESRARKALANAS